MRHRIRLLFCLFVTIAVFITYTLLDIPLLIGISACYFSQKVTYLHFLEYCSILICNVELYS